MRYSLPIVDQPMPADCAIAYSEHMDGTDTSISRVWADRDYLRCRLCPIGECTLCPTGMCLVVVKARIEPEDAWLFARRDIAGQRGPLIDDPRWFSSN